MSNCDFSIELGDGLYRCSVCNRLGGAGDVQDCRLKSTPKGKRPPPFSLLEAHQRAIKRREGGCGCGGSQISENK